VRRLLRDRRTYAVVLVLLVLVSVVIGSLRDDSDGDNDGGEAGGTPSVEVSPDESPSGTEPPDGADGGTDDAGPAYPTAVAPSPPRVDEETGLPIVRLTDLPPEAAETVELIESGGPFPYDDDGETFLNSAELLPPREPGYYRVYTVETPGSVEPTLRRIVTGTDGALYWTDDLYESFRRIE
jgi:ribonuclease T1